MLLLLFRLQGCWRLPLTRRPDTLATHAGQISFPGGEIESGETVFKWLHAAQLIKHALGLTQTGDPFRLVLVWYRVDGLIAASVMAAVIGARLKTSSRITRRNRK